MRIVTFIFKRLAIIGSLLLFAEVLFRAGVWESVAKPDSHSGISVTIKRAINHLEKPVDTVLLGSSRAQWGLDHAMLMAAAHERGLTHINMSFGGTHWMTIGVLTDWLKRNRPEVQGGIIATSIAEFTSVGNGTHELGIVYPFSGFDDRAWLALHVPTDATDPATFGSYSALVQYRADIRDLVVHPLDRWRSLRVSRTGANWLFDLPANPDNSCTVPIRKQAACAAFVATTPAERVLVEHCKSLGPPPAQRGDLAGIEGSKSLLALSPEFMRLKQIRARQIREIGWKIPPLIVLLPVHKMLVDEFYPKGLHEWTLSILQPLADEGVIQLLDYTDLFYARDGTDCTAFFDLYHQSAQGRMKLMSQLMPEVRQKLFSRVEKKPQKLTSK